MVLLVIGMIPSDPAPAEAIPPADEQPAQTKQPDPVPTEPVHECTIETWTVQTESTCSAEGIEAGVCTDCGKTTRRHIAKLPHTEGEWTVTKIATLREDGVRTLPCSVCGAALDTETFALSKEEFIERCETYTYKEIARYPDDYNGKYARFEGEVVQVMENTFFGKTTYTLRVNVTYDTYWYTDTVYVTYTPAAGEGRILEDDIIAMYGKLTGTVTYETVLGSSITIPSFEAKYIDLIQ